jgi:predicted RNase H-like HicB family nuclease
MGGLSVRYPAIVEGGGEDFGVWFPDLPGIVAMGNTLEEAIRHAEEALQDYAIESERDGLELKHPRPLEATEVPDGSSLTSVALLSTALNRIGPLP